MWKWSCLEQGEGIMSKHTLHERILLIEYQICEQQAHEKYNELEIIFQKMAELKVKIEEQVQKQVVE